MSASLSFSPFFPRSSRTFLRAALTWGAYAVGLLCSLFAYLYLRLTHPAYNADGQYTAPVILFAFLIGLQCCTFSGLSSTLVQWLMGCIL